MCAWRRWISRVGQQNYRRSRCSSRADTARWSKRVYAVRTAMCSSHTTAVSIEHEAWHPGIACCVDSLSVPNDHGCHLRLSTGMPALPQEGPNTPNPSVAHKVLHELCRQLEPCQNLDLP